jgi:hypothetical protein
LGRPPASGVSPRFDSSVFAAEGSTRLSAERRSRAGAFAPKAAATLPSRERGSPSFCSSAEESEPSRTRAGIDCTGGRRSALPIAPTRFLAKRGEMEDRGKKGEKDEIEDTAAMAIG